MNRTLVYIDGSSTGKYGYYIPETDQMKIVRDEPMTNNQAEYMALLALVMDLENGSIVLVKTDSQLLYHQYQDEWKNKDSELCRLKGVIKSIVKTKEIDLEMEWTPREQNLFGKKLDKAKNREKKVARKFWEDRDIAIS